MRALSNWAAFLAFIVLGACAADPDEAPPSDAQPRAPVALPSIPEPVAGNGVVGDLATIAVAVQPQWGPGPDGIGMTDDWGEHPVVLEPPVAASVLAGPVEIGGEGWYHVYVMPDAMRWPSDFAAWVPAVEDGATVLVLQDATDCPDGEVAEIARLTPLARVACFGDRTLQFVARSWLPGHWLPYATDPEWLGTPIEGSRSLSLFPPGRQEFPRPPDPRVAWIDARVHPGIEMPPAGVTLFIDGQFDHPDVDGCRRTRDRSGPPPQPPTAGLPDEGADTSAVWCRGQLVVNSWEILLGPEGRPPIAGDVQLHRTDFEGDACGGVGMPLLRFRMDADAPDPIWLEPMAGGPPSIPVFGARFRVATQPELAIIGPAGEVVAVNGTPLNPDEPFGNYAVCPMGDTVTITRP